MSDEDLEIIPILDDVVVAGDLNKAVTGDIDEKDLESIEAFDALFDEEKNDSDTFEHEATEQTPVFESNEENHIESGPEIETPTTETAIDNLYSSPDIDYLNDEQDDDPDTTESENIITESTFDQETTTADMADTDAFTDDHNETNHDEHDDITDISDTEPSASISFIEQTGDLASSNQSLIDQSFEEQDTDDEIDEHDDTNVYHMETMPESETDLHAVTSQQEPTLDTNQIAEKVMQEIMPEIETQIRSIVLASLEKHLSKSSSDSDNDL